MCWKPASKSAAGRGAAAARLSGDRLFLAPDHAGAGRGRVSCRRPRPARLWPHHRVGRRLRRRSAPVPHPERGARRAGAGFGPRPLHGRGGRRPRFRRRGRRLVRAGAARSFPLAGADERAVRRAAAIALRHRRRAAARTPRRATTSTRPWPSSTGRASITSGIIRPARPMPTCGIARRGSTPFCAAISITRAPTGPATGRTRCNRGAPANWPRCRPTTSWISPGTWPRRWRR